MFAKLCVKCLLRIKIKTITFKYHTHTINFNYVIKHTIFAKRFMFKVSHYFCFNHRVENLYLTKQEKIRIIQIANLISFNTLMAGVIIKTRMWLKQRLLKENYYKSNSKNPGGGHIKLSSN